MKKSFESGYSMVVKLVDEDHHVFVYTSVEVYRGHPCNYPPPFPTPSVSPYFVALAHTHIHTHSAKTLFSRKLQFSVCVDSGHRGVPTFFLIFVITVSTSCMFCTEPVGKLLYNAVPD